MRRVIIWSVNGVCLAFVIASVGWAWIASAERAVLYAPVPILTVTPLPSPTAQDMRFAIQSADHISRTLRISFIAKQIKGDWLFESPVFRVGQQEYIPSPTSLKQARLDLLKTITAGQADSMLEFENVADESGSGTLVLNPTSQLSNIVSPHLELRVTWRTTMDER